MLTVDFSKLPLTQGTRILDIGCGEGRHTAHAYEHPGVICIGADRNPGDLAVSKNKLELHQALTGRTGSVWTLTAADICQLPFPDQSLDIIICSEVLEHIPDDKKAIAELARIIKPGGTLAVSVPRYWPEAICWMLSLEYRTSKGGHIRIYQKNKLIKKICISGFSLHGQHHAHSLHSPFWWLKCLTGINKTDSLPVNLYHRLLVWDLMKKPAITRFLDQLLNPVMGKSLVLYFKRLGNP